MAHDESTSPDIESMQRRIEALEREVEANRRDARRWRAFMEARILSVSISDDRGYHKHMNPGWEQLWRMEKSNLLAMGYNVLQDPQLAERGISPYIEQLYRGEEVNIPPVDYDVKRADGAKDDFLNWVCTFGVPIPDASGRVEEVVLVQCRIPEAEAIQLKYEDLLAEQQRLQASLSARNQALEEQVRLIEAQHEAIQALSVPVIRIWDGVLCLPIVGTIDDARASRLLERLLDAITAQGAEEVIIDVTGVPALDEATAGHLLKAAAAVRLLGARCALVGVSPAIARTLVDLDVDLGAVATSATLAEGLSGALSRRAGGQRSV